MNILDGESKKRLDFNIVSLDEGLDKTIEYFSKIRS